MSIIITIGFEHYDNWELNLALVHVMPCSTNTSIKVKGVCISVPGMYAKKVFVILRDVDWSGLIMIHCDQSTATLWLIWLEKNIYTRLHIYTYICICTVYVCLCVYMSIHI